MNEQTAPPFWDEEAVSKADVESFIGQPENSDNPGYVSSLRVLQLEDVDCDNWEDGPRPGCYASFGDQVTTATVGAFGQLLQFSGFLGAGSSGMFSIDQARVWEPYLVEMRARRLEELSQQAFHFGIAISATATDRLYGLRIPSLVLKPGIQAQLQWTNWRWPRHEYSRGSFEGYPNLKLTIQWMIHQGTLLQQCLLDNRGEDLNCVVEFSKSMIIRDLDHLDHQFGFNEEGTSHQDTGPGPKQYSWVCLHRFSDAKHELKIATPKTLPEERSVGQNQESGDELRRERRGEPENKLEGHETESKGPHGALLVCSVAIDGKVQLFDDNTSTQRWPVKLCSKSPQTREADGRPQVFELITAYEMSLLEKPKTDWKTLIIPWHKMEVNKFLQEQPPPEPLPICSPIPLRDSMSDMMQASKDLLNSGNINGLGDIRGSKRTDSDGTAPTPTKPVFVGPSPGNPGTSSPQLRQGALHKYLAFISRRNLEHILSVCAVKATPKASDTTVTGSLPDALRPVEAVALTCGDMSGHRICWSASFFAFRFLVEFYKALECHSKEPHIKSVRERIQETCLGHLKWLHLIQQQGSGQRFGRNYWVTGKLAIKPEASGSWAAGESLLDTGLQVLKAAACMELWDETEIAANLMSDWAPSWLVSMEKSDKRKKYAWPHSEKEGINTFRLDEQVWIWRALKSLEMKNYRAWNAMSEKPPKKVHQLSMDEYYDLMEGDVSRDGQDAPTRTELEDLRKTFASNVVQREISRRFTTENTVLRKRMLATTRSIRESRFMLHSRDTALLYKDIFDFLGEDSPAKELLKTTIQCQMYHTEYQESSWEKTLRYALYIMLGARGLSINNMPPNELIRTATDILIRSFSSSGFFPGRIDTSTTKPVGVSCVAEENMESYYHASFEIPYILLTHLQQVGAAYTRPGPEAPKSRRKSDPIPGYKFPLKKALPHDVGMMQGDAVQRKMLLRLSDILLGRSTISDLDNNEVFRDVRLTMKKSVPFDRLVDSSNIVKLDDEWLYKYPDFFSKGKILKDDGHDESRKELQFELESLEATSGPTAFNRNTARTFRSCIVDVRSSKRVEGKQKEHRPTYHEGDFGKLTRVIARDRTAEDAKKRLHSLVMVTKEFALLCYDTTEASERLNLKDFFQRHSRHSKHSFDNCSMIENYWESEFHLSYYQLLRDCSTLRNCIAPPDSEPFSGDLNTRIVRVSASFRFHGDFFDRHWTCYMLDSTPNGPITNPDLLNERKYCQRKVLEQRYFADILKSLTESVGEILSEVSGCLGVESGSFSTSIDTKNAYSSWRAVWQKYQPLLQKLHDDLASSQNTVGQWEAREEDRGKEKPRWTSNDERKYRGTIMTIRREIKHRTSQLQQLHEKTKSLQDLCSNRLDKAREDLTFRSEQNIATFTYVTVVFLPIGFTASIFSMNGSPDTTLAIEMVIASVIALAVTVLALMNAKGLAGVLENIATSYNDLTAKAKQSSVMIRDREAAEKKRTKSNPGNRNPSRHRVSSTDAMSWNLIFWTGYIFMELPSRSITAACRTLGWRRNVHKDLEDLKIPKRIFAQGVVASGLLYCLVPGMALLEKEAADVSRRSSMKIRPKSAAQLVAEQFARVILAFFTVPIFLLTWILQILCFNAWDAVALLGELLRSGISHISLPNSDELPSSLLTYLTKPPKYFRPMKLWKDHLRPEQKTPQS